MKKAGIALTLLMVIIIAFFSGCTSSSEPAPAETPVPVTTATPIPTIKTAAVTAAPTDIAEGPVESLPAAQQVNLELTKDRPTSKIHLLYQGGPGIVFTQSIIMRVYSSDGRYEEYVMNEGKKPAAGDEIVAQGTRGGDRCVVFVTSAGTSYKVLDKTMYSDL